MGSSDDDAKRVDDGKKLDEGDHAGDHVDDDEKPVPVHPHPLDRGEEVVISGDERTDGFITQAKVDELVTEFIAEKEAKILEAEQELDLEEDGNGVVEKSNKMNKNN